MNHFMSRDCCILSQRLKKRRVEFRGGNEIVTELSEEEDWDSEDLKSSGIIPESERELMEEVAQDLNDEEDLGRQEFIHGYNRLKSSGSIEEVSILSVCFPLPFLCLSVLGVM